MVKMQMELLSFVLSAGEWITKTNAIGIYSKHKLQAEGSELSEKIG